LQFLLVFLVDMRPQDVLRRGTIEVPIALGAVDVLELHDSEAVLDFRRQQISVLVANVGRRAFQMHIDPAATLEAISALQTGLVTFGCVLFGNGRPGETAKQT
jgi:hypothetical protein